MGAWMYLILAGLLEIGFTTSLVLAEQASSRGRILWYAAFVVSLSLSMYLLIIASRNIPMGTAYAVFTGIGAVGTALMGILVFEESASFWRLFFLFTLIASIVGLNLVSGEKV